MLIYLSYGISSHYENFGLIMLSNRHDKGTYPSNHEFNQLRFKLDFPFSDLKNLKKFTTLNYLGLYFCIASN